MAVWLGKISAALYLIHFPIKDYTVWAINRHTVTRPGWDCGPLPEGSGLKTLCDYIWEVYYNETALRLWAVPIVVVLSIIAAALLFYGFEEPLRRCMRKEKRIGVISTVTSTTTTTPTITVAAADVSHADLKALEDGSGEGGSSNASVV